VAGCFEGGDEPSGCCSTELVLNFSQKLSDSNILSVGFKVL
jgi:hypothetical protein